MAKIRQNIPCPDTCAMTIVPGKNPWQLKKTEKSKPKIRVLPIVLLKIVCITISALSERGMVKHLSELVPSRNNLGAVETSFPFFVTFFLYLPAINYYSIC